MKHSDLQGKTFENDATPADLRGMTRREALVGAALVGVACVLGRSATAAPTGSATVTNAGSGAAADPATAVSVRLPQRIYGNDAFPVWYRRTLPLDTPSARYPGFKPGTRLLKAGTLRRVGAMPLPVDIILERDVALKMRDGTTIYSDVFRPAAPGRYPAVLAWSPYGKEIGGQWFDDVPGRSGVPLSNVSELQKFEGPDPATFCAKGYVIINPDPRGAGMSEGNINFWGRQLAEDGYDTIEWAAAQPWCSGKVALAGNSWLAISQWFIAAAKPPHLAAIAPWEGGTDHYPKGGINEIGFAEVILQTFAGRYLVEDLPRMTVEQGFLSPYWLDKVADLKKIEIPAYVVASYTHPGHSWGSFHGFRNIASKHKWLRVHNTNEWHDFNQPAHQDDLIRFFDYFLKGEDNGWDRTPPARLAVLNPGGDDIVARPEESFPLARQKFTKFYLANHGTLAEEPQGQPGRLSYAAIGGDVAYTVRFDKDTEVTGYMCLKFWVEAAGSTDMDIRVNIEKLGKNGEQLLANENNTLGRHLAADGALRVSMRALDPLLSTPSEPVLSLAKEQLLKPGEIVAVEVGIWPIGLLFQAGDQLKLTISGTRELPPMKWGFGEAIIPVPRNGGTFAPGSTPELLLLGGPTSTRPEYSRAQAVPELPQRNAGTHIVHFGGMYDSHLLIPVIPG